MARVAALGPHKDRLARQMRATAALLDADHPETVTGGHLRDAARVLEHGSYDGAKRHLDAAMEVLTPRNLYRHGITDDDAHSLAKHHMHQVHRHRLGVQDIEDLAGRNARLAAFARAARGQPEPAEPFHRPPPEPPQQIAAAQDHYGNRVVDLVGPHGYVHGWVKVEDAGHLDGQHVLGTDAHGQTFLGTYSHAQRSVLPRPGKLQTRYVRRATDQDVMVIRREQQRRHAVRMGLRRAEGGLANSSPAVLLSARTPMLERTPAPRGRPGGPGLYHVKGMGHTPYLQQIVKALIEKRGMPPGRAYAIARGAIRKWMRGGGHVHPEVAAAAGRAEAGEIARQARAHAHAGDPWEAADALIELACAPPVVIELFNPYHGAGGRFTTASGAQQGKGKQQAAARRDRKADAPQRRELTRKIASLRLQLSSLEAQLHAATSHRSTSAASRTGKSKAATPAKKGAGATSAAAAKAGKTAASAARRTTASPASLRRQIQALRATLLADIAELRHL